MLFTRFRVTVSRAIIQVGRPKIAWIAGMLAVAGLLAGCASETPILAATAAPQATSTAISSPTVAAPTLAPTVSETLPASPTSSPSSTPGPSTTPSPWEGWTIDALAARSYGGSGIVLGEIVASEATFSRYAMHYDSDGLTITGIANMPTGEGPFPVIIVNHGYGPQASYYPGYDSEAVGAGLARHGYLTLMPDYRGYGGSDDGPNPFRIGYAIDVMNLVAQVGSLPQANPEQIGVIGHSMGGGASAYPMVLQGDQVDAVALYAAMSADLARNWRHIHQMWNRPAQEAAAATFGYPDEEPEAYAAASPISYLDRVSMPVLLIHGTEDDQVPYEWSEDLATRLRAAGKDVYVLTFEGEGHTLYGEAFDTFLARTVSFFDEHVRGSISTE